MSLFSLILGTRDLDDILPNLEAKHDGVRCLAAINLQKLASERQLPNSIVQKIYSVLQRPKESIETAAALLRTLFHINTEYSLIVAEWYLCQLAKDLIRKKGFLERAFTRHVIKDIQDYISPSLLSYYAICFASTRSILDPSSTEGHRLVLYQILKSMNYPEILELIPEEKRAQLEEKSSTKEKIQKFFGSKSPVVAAKVLNAGLKSVIERATPLKLPLNTKIIGDDFFKDLDVLMIPYEVKKTHTPLNLSDLELPELESVPKEKIPDVLEKYVDLIANICGKPSFE